MAADRDAQRRELEEIRRKFTEMGARVGSLFEPGPDEDHHPQDTQDPRDAREAVPAGTAPGRPGSPAPAGVSRLLAVAAVVVALLVGTGLGYVLPRAGATSPPRAPAAQPPVSTQATVSTGVAQPRTVTSVPPACLETARKGDLTIHLYTINVRDRRLVQALKAYTLASQACRREASP
jgi:hypothetical protein